jgi:hypothetical protein
MTSEVNPYQGEIEIIGKISNDDRSSAIDAIQDLLYAKASDAMTDYKQIVAKTFFDEPTETETDETDNGTD